MKDWISRKESERIELLQVAVQETNLPDYMVEKDWWVTTMLEAIFSSKLKEHFAFKGGTSLSKSWKILKRFSEDIDIVIEKKLFGFSDDASPGRSQREKLRDKAHEFITKEVHPILNNRLLELGLPGDTFNLYLDKNKSSDQDPTIIFLDYNPLTNIPTGHPTETRVRIEIGVRGMMEPTEQRPISSLLSEYLGKEEKFGVRSVLPQRTFWEKVFLIHELFQKEIDKIDVSRMSRHWYDLHSLNLAGFGEQAMADKVLFEAIRGHRGVFTKVPGVDYGVLKANSFNLFPPDALQGDWGRDYDSMIESYIYQNAPTMQELAKGIETIATNLKALSF